MNMADTFKLTVIAILAVAALLSGARAETAAPAAAHAAPMNQTRLIEALRLKVDETGLATERLILANASRAVATQIARREPGPFARPLVRPFAYAHLAP
jgi:hypothetical protein